MSRFIWITSPAFIPISALIWELIGAVNGSFGRMHSSFSFLVHSFKSPLFLNVGFFACSLFFCFYIPPFLHIFLLGFLAHSFDILLTVKWMEKLQNNSEIWKKSARDMQQLWVKTHKHPCPTLCSHLLPLSIDNKNNRRPVEKLRCCCRNIPKWWNVFAASWDTRSPYSHALLFKTHYIHTDGRNLN